MNNAEPRMTSPRRRWIRLLLVLAAVFVLILLWVEASSAEWEEKVASGPSARYYNGIAYDAARGETLFFGGFVPGTAFDDTWVWNGSTWTQKTPTTSPSPRVGTVMAYDSARGVVVLFGGANAAGSEYYGDTWEWNGSIWTLVAVTGPSGRRPHAMAFDSARGVVVLFGGYDGSFLDDTWEWNGVSWTNPSTPTAPAARGSHRMVYDSGRAVTVLYGGYNGSTLDDTWEWNGSTWTNRSATLPGPRGNHAMAYDSARGVTVLFGGLDNTVTSLSDTWEWDGSSWVQTETNGPSGRYNVLMAYDSARNVCVLRGGFGPPALGDTWEYSSSATGIGGDSPPPASRFTIRAVPNPSRGALRLSLEGASESGAHVSLFDVAGRLIRDFGLVRDPVQWDGTGRAGERVAGGMYLVTAGSGDERTTTKILVLR